MADFISSYPSTVFDSKMADVDNLKNGAIKTNAGSIQGKPISATAPTDLQVPAYNSTSGQYEPRTLIESGTNANGSYEKFADGYMECRQYVSSATTSSAGKITWTYPSAFKTGEIPVVHPSVVCTLSIGQNAQIGTTPTANAVDIAFTLNNAAVNAQAVRYCVTATGFWK